MTHKEKAAGTGAVPSAARKAKQLGNSKTISETVKGRALDNSAHAQRQRILKAIRRSPVTTLQARKLLDVMHPAARVMELRRDGHEIITSWVVEHTAANKPHRVAKYVLLPGPKKGATP